MYQKYLKYKTKYENLKRVQNGGTREEDQAAFEKCVAITNSLPDKVTGKILNTAFQYFFRVNNDEDMKTGLKNEVHIDFIDVNGNNLLHLIVLCICHKYVLRYGPYFMKMFYVLVNDKKLRLQTNKAGLTPVFLLTNMKDKTLLKEIVINLQQKFPDVFDTVNERGETFFSLLEQQNKGPQISLENDYNSLLQFYINNLDYKLQFKNESDKTMSTLLHEHIITHKSQEEQKQELQLQPQQDKFFIFAMLNIFNNIIEQSRELVMNVPQLPGKVLNELSLNFLHRYNFDKDTTILDSNSIKSFELKHAKLLKILNVPLLSVEFRVEQIPNPEISASASASASEPNAATHVILSEQRKLQKIYTLLFYLFGIKSLAGDIYSSSFILPSNTDSSTKKKIYNILLNPNDEQILTDYFSKYKQYFNSPTKSENIHLLLSLLWELVD